MTAELIALKCENCGNAESIIKPNIAFGNEFTCKYCGTTSVLVINNRLYEPNPGERVCIKCGRVADRNARVCQCTAPLVRKCINPKCLKEFRVDHRICDYCGWDQSVNPTSDEAFNIKLGRSIKDLTDPDPNVVAMAREDVKRAIIEADPNIDFSVIIQELLPVANILRPIFSDLIKPGNSIIVQRRAWDLFHTFPAFSLSNDEISGLIKLFVMTKDEWGEIITTFNQIGAMVKPILVDFINPIDTDSKAIRAWQLLGYLKPVGNTEKVINTLVKIFAVTEYQWIENTSKNELLRIGPPIVNSLVIMMDTYPTYAVREKVTNLLVEVGVGGVEKIAEAMGNPSVSSDSRDWLKSTINKIRGGFRW